MNNTKENILTTALRLFARDGYEAVSVSAIAGEMGMTKGALYKHYKNKRDIFDSIIKRMYQIDTQRAQLYEMPEEEYLSNSENYGNLQISNIKKFTISQLRFWSEDTFALNFRRMLALEQYRSSEMGKLYSNCVTSGPVRYMEGIFNEMIKRKILKDADPKQLALEFYAPVYLLVCISDIEDDFDKHRELIDNHIDKFFANNTVKG